MFITFEAGEGAGKTTQARLLATDLRAAGHDVVLTREPGGSAVAEDLRNTLLQGDPDRIDAMTELLVFTAARRDHILKTIQPALDQGKIVICDRYIGSTYALQGAGGIPDSTISAIHQLAGATLVPDLTIHLCAGAEKGLLRSLARNADQGTGETRFENKGGDFHADVVARFARLAAETPYWVTLDAEGSIPDVQARVWDTVTSHPFYRPACGRSVSVH